MSNVVVDLVHIQPAQGRSRPFPLQYGDLVAECDDFDSNVTTCLEEYTNRGNQGHENRNPGIIPIIARPATAVARQCKPLISRRGREWATVNSELRRTRQVRGTTPPTFAAFGDPRYERTALAGDGARGLRSAAPGNPFQKLRFSRPDVQAIRALYPSSTLLYLGPDATEEQANSLGPDVRYIHFATLGIFDEDLPLHSALVLSTPGKDANARENGLLPAWEIYEQVRWNADLVVLSACESGLAKNQERRARRIDASAAIPGGAICARLVMEGRGSPNSRVDAEVLQASA